MKHKILALAVGIVMAAQAAAIPAPATNPGAPVVGTLPNTGGALDVQLVIADIVHISGLDSIDLGTYAGDSVPMTNAAAPETFCIFRNGDGDYELTLQSANANVSGSHNLINGAGNLIPYVLDFSDAAGTHADILSSATAETRTGGGLAANPTCNGNANNNASLVVTVDDADLDAAAPGTYNDTITITVTAI